MADKVLKKTKRGDGKYNVLMSIDGEDHMLMGAEEGTNAVMLKAYKEILAKQAEDRIAQVKDEIRQWKGQEVDEVISHKDIDDRLLELYSEKEGLETKVGKLVVVK